MARAKLIEAADGVHIPTLTHGGARALCDPSASILRCFRAAQSRIVSCPACAAIVTACRGVRVVGDAEKKTAKAAASERGLRFAEWFATTLDPKASKAAGWRDKWAAIYDRLIEMGKTPDQIAAVCRYGRTNSFWNDKFQSPARLLKRDAGEALYFDRFLAALKPVDAARLVREAGQEKEGPTAAKVIEFK